MKNRMILREMIVAVVFIVFLQQGIVVQAAASDEQGIEEFITRLYEAKEKGDGDLLLSYGASKVQIASDLTYVECGLMAYHNIQVQSFQSSENTWLVLVGFCSEFEDVDAWLPEMRTEYVVKNEQGQFMLPWQTEESPPMVNKHLELTMTDPEIAGLLKSNKDSYTKVMQNDVYGQLQAFDEKVRETYDRMIQELDFSEESTDQGDASMEGDADHFYTVQSGDCLWSIAEEYLGSGRNWPVLYKKNRGIIGESPDIIYPGQQLDLEMN